VVVVGCFFVEVPERPALAAPVVTAPSDGVELPESPVGTVWQALSAHTRKTPASSRVNALIVDPNILRVPVTC